MHGSGKLPWGRGLCNMCDQCRATSSLSHPITGWTLTRLTDAGQSSFCSLAATVSHMARGRWLEVFWILLIGSRHRNAHWDLWNGTVGRLSTGVDTWQLLEWDKCYEPSSMAADHTASQLPSIHICFHEQGGNMATTMSWGFSDFRHLFCFTLLINKACMYHNHIQLLYIFNNPANEFWVSFSFKYHQYPNPLCESLTGFPLCKRCS